ncbi:hypothetical protein [Acetobacter nitrogenifigens]
MHDPISAFYQIKSTFIARVDSRELLRSIEISRQRKPRAVATEPAPRIGI